MTLSTIVYVAAIVAAAPAPGAAAGFGDTVPAPRLFHYPFPHTVERVDDGCGTYDAATGTYQFCVTPLRGGGSRTLTAKKFAETKDLYYFAEVNAAGEILHNSRAPQDFLDNFQSVYEQETAEFGTASDIDGDGHLWVLDCDLGDTPGAYYDPGYTNHVDMLTFDYRVDDAGEFGSHELMHDILGNYDIGEELWVFEGTAMYASNWWSKGQGPYGDGRHIEYIHWAHTYNIPLTWGAYDPDLMKSMVQYEIAYLFMLYLADQYGGPDFIGDLMRDGPSRDPAAGTHVHGIDGVNAALRRAGSARDYSQVFDDWVTANYLNKCPDGNTTYCYTTMHQFVDPSYRHTQYPADGYGPIAAWAGQVVEFYSPGFKQGRLDVTFNGDTGTVYTVRAATLSSLRDKLPAVFEVTLGADNTGAFSYDAFGKDFDTVALVVAAHGPGDNIYFRYHTAFTETNPPDAGDDAGLWVYDGGWDGGAEPAAADAGAAGDGAGCSCSVLGL